MTWICTAAGLPLPSVFLSGHDASVGAPPIPGMGTIVCRPVSALTAARVARATLSLLRWVLETFPE